MSFWAWGRGGAVAAGMIWKRILPLWEGRARERTDGLRRAAAT